MPADWQALLIQRFWLLTSVLYSSQQEPLPAAVLDGTAAVCRIEK